MPEQQSQVFSWDDPNQARTLLGLLGNKLYSLSVTLRAQAPAEFHRDYIIFEGRRYVELQPGETGDREEARKRLIVGGKKERILPFTGVEYQRDLNMKVWFAVNGEDGTFRGDGDLSKIVEGYRPYLVIFDEIEKKCVDATRESARRLSEEKYEICGIRAQVYRPEASLSLYENHRGARIEFRYFVQGGMDARKNDFTELMNIIGATELAHDDPRRDWI